MCKGRSQTILKIAVRMLDIFLNQKVLDLKGRIWWWLLRFNFLKITIFRFWNIFFSEILSIGKKVFKTFLSIYFTADVSIFFGYPLLTSECLRSFWFFRDPKFSKKMTTRFFSKRFFKIQRQKLKNTNLWMKMCTGFSKILKKYFFRIVLRKILEHLSQARFLPELFSDQYFEPIWWL